jgi:hypothetical protein
VVELGRLGSAAVLADYITQCSSYVQEMLYKEKIIAMGVVNIYLINKVYTIFFILFVV